MLVLLLACTASPDDSTPPADSGKDTAVDTADSADTGDSVDCGNGVKAEIVQPRNNESFTEGEEVLFTGNYNLGVPTWTLDGTLVKRAYETSWIAAGVGDHVVGMEVESTDCGTATDAHDITVVAAE